MGEDVDLDGNPPSVAVLRADRAGKDTKTPRSSGKEDYHRRLRKIEGQVRGLQRMIEADTWCPDVATQVASATRALQEVAVGGVISGLAALAHETRLELFRQLVRKGVTGESAGELARTLGIPPQTLSFHLKEMTHAGLLRPRREGRQIYYIVDFGHARACSSAT